VAEYKQNLLNEKLKQKEEEEKRNAAAHADDNKPLALDDAQRIKVLSPSSLVAKRFFKNKLALVGLAILIFMFAMSFIGPFFYPYKQTDKFSTVNALELDYAVCGELTSFTKYLVVNDDAAKDAKLLVDSFIKTLNEKGENSGEFSRGNSSFIIEKSNDYLYRVYATSFVLGNIDALTGAPKSGEFTDEEKDALASAIESRQTEFDLGSRHYVIDKKSKTLAVVTVKVPAEEKIEVILASKLVLDAVKTGTNISESFKVAVLNALDTGSAFEYEGATYTFETGEGDNVVIKDASGNPYVVLSHYSIRHASGEDSFDIDFKNRVAEVVSGMEKSGEKFATFEYDVPQLNPETKKYDVDENGNYVLERETLSVTPKETAGERRYYVTYSQRKEVIDIYGAPSAKHILGTDGDGFDVFSRIMYGGRVSLIVGFVVVILETILGVIMGGIAGFFGGWVDTLIMRLVDIFYCIPTMPIMIILASLFDQLQMPPYNRLFWMMVVLGILGWSGIARLVRGQILSLREQEFMIAAEATGLKTSRRIFKHLVPNVMPQLIVSMTMGLGGVILMESSLSYLGLGVKHPLATWGNIINSVSTIDAMKSYTYIWIPVGVLICLTVIAFNFVGDGLRDAFDPKMKR